MILIHNRVSYERRGSYTSINKSDVLRAIKTLNHEGLKGWMMCSLNSEGFPRREGTNEISREALNELCRKGYMRRTDDQGNWEFDAAGGYTTQTRSNPSPTGRQDNNAAPAQQNTTAPVKQQENEVHTESTSADTSEKIGTKFYLSYGDLYLSISGEQVYHKDGRAVTTNDYENYVDTGYSWNEALKIGEENNHTPGYIVSTDLPF